MSRKNTYLLGGAAILVGVILIVIALAAMSGDGDGDAGTTTSKSPAAGPSGEAAPAGSGGSERPSDEDTPESGGLARKLERREKAPAPGFALEVVGKGDAPPQAKSLEQAVAGDSLALTGLRGTPVVLHMWSSRCGPCRSDARLIQTTWQRWGRRGVAFVGLSVEEPAADAERFARDYDLTYPIVRDGSGRVADAYGVTALPQTFFISSSGEVVGQVSGSPSVRQMELGAAAARAGRAFGSEQGGSREPRG